MYRIVKVLNNNGILVLDDESKQEQILLGNGVGFGHRMGERMKELPNARRYELVSEKTSALTRVNGIDPILLKCLEGSSRRQRKFWGRFIMIF